MNNTQARGGHSDNVGILSPSNRGSSNTGINIASIGEGQAINYGNAIDQNEIQELLDENQMEENIRDAAHAIEELQRI